MPEPTALPFATVLVLGAAGSGRHALARALAHDLAGSAVRVAVVEDIAALPDAARPRPLVLLLAPHDAAGEAEDLRWRDALARAGLPYGVLHGTSNARLVAARTLAGGAPAPDASAPAAATTPSSAWRWRCDKCSDPACEHRLFRDLLAQRESAPPAH